VEKFGDLVVTNKKIDFNSNKGWSLWEKHGPNSQKIKIKIGLKNSEFLQ
jgi:hypothetical protein